MRNSKAKETYEEYCARLDREEAERREAERIARRDAYLESHTVQPHELDDSGHAAPYTSEQAAYDDAFEAHHHGEDGITS